MIIEILDRKLNWDWEFTFLCIWNLWTFVTRSKQKCYHECEILPGKRPETAESEYSMSQCRKNPGHENFISAHKIRKDIVPSFQLSGDQGFLLAWMDLTVRLRMRWTSLSRPDDDLLSDLRGTDGLRVGTGYVSEVKDCGTDAVCPCSICGGTVRRQFWKFIVWTSHHVVFDLEEAKFTKVDLFYDDENCPNDGRMKTVEVLQMLGSIPEGDFCGLNCITHDRSLAEKIMSASLCLRSNIDLSSISLLQKHNLLGTSGDFAVIVSHPHGQPKMITVGKATINPNKDGSTFNASIVYGNNVKCTFESIKVEYNTPTCPGSSGAPVFAFSFRGDRIFSIYHELAPVHSGTHDPHPDCDLFKYLKTILKKCVNSKLFISRQHNYGYSIFYSNNLKKKCEASQINQTQVTFSTIG